MCISEWLRRSAGLLFAASLGIGVVAAAEQFTVVRLNLAGSERVTRTQNDYIYSVEIWNDGEAATSVAATVSSASPDTTVVAGILDFGNVAARQTALSKNTFIIRHDRTAPFDLGLINFAFRSGNQPPVARVSADQIARNGETVAVDGGASYDPDGDPLTFEWSVRVRPAGTAPPAFDSHAKNFRFFVAAPATYEFTLTVSDGRLRSAPAVTVIRTGPVAKAGTAQTVRAGDVVTLNATASYDSENRPLTYEWTLVRPAGSTAVLNHEATARPFFVADAPGEYAAALRVSNGISLSAPDETTVTAVTGPMVCGSLMSGSIAAAAESVQYTFSGQAGQMVTLTAAVTGGFVPYTAWLTVLRPGGVVLDEFGANGQRQLTLPDAGTYTVRVRASNFTATGTFNVGLECRRPAAANDAALACGSLISGSIAAPAEVDQISFSGQTGQLVTLTLVITSGFSPYTAWATVFTPAGGVLVEFGANGQQQLSLPAAGTYIVQIRASNFVATGSYNLGFECRRPVSPVDAALGCGGLITGTLGSPGEVDQLVFQANANDRITLTLAVTGGFSPYTTWLSVFSPSGAMLTEFGANGQQQITIPLSGTYVIQVRASNFVATGTYNIGLECPYPIDPPLSCGSLVPASIAAAAEVDQFAFQGSASQLITLTLAVTAGFSPYTAWATVLSPTGAIVTQFGANGQQQLTLPATGVYVVQVRASNFVARGSYNIGLECRRPVSPIDASLSCGSLPAGSISTAGEVDQLTFSGTLNQQVTLTLAVTSGFSPYTAWATVFTPAGEILTQFGANGQMQVTLPAAGVYLVQIRASNFVATGGYRFGLECMSPPGGGPRALGCGALLSDTLTAPGDIDQFTFTGTAGQQVTLTLAISSGFSPYTAWLTVFTPSGSVFTSFGANGQQQLTLPDAGTYVVQIRASNFVAVGAYNIGFECRRPVGGTVTSLACGTLAPDSITGPADLDQFKFAGSLNQQVTLTLAVTQGFTPYNAWVTLFAPSGAIVAQFGANGQNHLTLPEAGTYLAQVRASNFVAAGSYNLGLECRVSVRPVDGTLVCGGAPTAGTITAPADVDQLTFAGTAGSTVTLTLAVTSGFVPYTAWATVFGPSGTVVGSFGANGQSNIGVTQTGTHVVQVRASNFVASGGYSAALQCP